MQSPAASIPKVEKAVAAVSLDNAPSKSRPPTTKPASKPPTGSTQTPKSSIRAGNPISQKAKTKKTVLIQEVTSPFPSRPHDQPATNRKVPDKAISSTSDVLPRTDSSLEPPHQPYSGSPISPTEITYSTLEILLRQNGTKSDIVQETLLNLDAGKLPEIFGQSGFDSNFLEAFLEAILSQPHQQDWVSHSISLLDAIRKCGRFNIALTFAPMDKIQRVFQMLGQENVDAERLQKVKSFWI
jgi:hypothetical protein